MRQKGREKPKTEVIVDNLEANVNRLISAFESLKSQIRDTKPTIIKDDQKILDWLDKFQIEPTDLSNLETLLKGVESAVRSLKFEQREVISVKEANDLIKAITAVKRAVMAQDLSVSFDTDRIESLLKSILDEIPRVEFPEDYPLPDSQLQKLLDAFNDLATQEGLEDIVSAIKKIRVGGGGGGTDIVGLKNEVNGRDTRVNVATEDTLDEIKTKIGGSLENYKVADIVMSESGYNYYGYVDQDENWYIMREGSSGTQYRFASGTGSYETAWTNRASQSYDYLFNAF